MRVKNKKLRKLRQYRDKLLSRITILEGKLRHNEATFRDIRKSLQREDTMRAYALASDPDETSLLKNFVTTNSAACELALVYRFLAVERKFTADVHRAALQRDYLRVAALCADHIAESVAHDRMLTEWSKDHGFTRTLREEMQDEMVA